MFRSALMELKPFNDVKKNIPHFKTVLCFHSKKETGLYPSILVL
jgi:hypothetical protein